jgi:hypothetical protein
MCHYLFPGGKDLGGAAVHHTTEGENNGVERAIAGWALADLVDGNRVEVLVDQPGLVVVVLREAGGACIRAGQGTNSKVVFGIGWPCGRRAKQSQNLDVIASAGLVAARFESDQGTRGGGEGLSDDTLGSFLPGHTPRLHLKADLGVPK